MSRLAWVLTALVAVLLVVLWWFLLWNPTSEEIEDVRAETERVQTQGQQQRQRAAQLRQIRESAPESEAQLAASHVLIPTDVGIPSLLRVLQTAADEADVRLNSISPSAPAASELDGANVNVVAVSMALDGTYFQLIDFIRRIEDPAITARAMTWTAASISPGEYPTLTATLSGQIYARSEVLPEPPAPEPDPAAEPEDGVDDPPVIDDEEVVS